MRLATSHSGVLIDRVNQARIQYQRQKIESTVPDRSARQAHIGAKSAPPPSSRLRAPSAARWNAVRRSAIRRSRPKLICSLRSRRSSVSVSSVPSRRCEGLLPERQVRRPHPRGSAHVDKHAALVKAKPVHPGALLSCARRYRSAAPEDGLGRKVRLASISVPTASKAKAQPRVRHAALRSENMQPIWQRAHDLPPKYRR